MQRYGRVMNVTDPRATDPPFLGPAETDPVGPAAVAPLRSIGLCAAWSHHAAEIAVGIGAHLERLEETPTTVGMLADGVVVRILPGVFLPPDLLGSAVERALAIGCALGEHLQSHHVVSGTSAAWVLLGGHPSLPLELLSPAHRGRVAGVVLRHARLAPGEIDTLGGAPVTTPRRTATDLLRFAPEPLAGALLRALIEAALVEEGEIAASLEGMYRHPGVHAARERLERILEDEEQWPPQRRWPQVTAWDVAGRPRLIRDQDVPSGRPQRLVAGLSSR